MAILRRGVGLWGLAGVVLLASAVAGRGEDDGLTGTWYGPDGVTASVRQVGTDLFWVARSGDGGRTFVSAFHGRLTGHHLTGQFADVPDGNNRVHGSLRARVVFENGRAVAMRGEILLPDDDRPRSWSISRTKPEK